MLPTIDEDAWVLVNSRREKVIQDLQRFEYYVATPSYAGVAFLFNTSRSFNLKHIRLH